MGSVYFNIVHVFAAGRIPTEIGELSALKELELRRNGLSGLCQKSCCFGTFTKIFRPYTVRRCCPGRIPTEIGRLTALDLLMLQDNALTGQRFTHVTFDQQRSLSSGL